MSSLNLSLDCSGAAGVLMPLPWWLLTAADILAQQIAQNVLYVWVRSYTLFVSSLQVEKIASKSLNAVNYYSCNCWETLLEELSEGRRKWQLPSWRMAGALAMTVRFCSLLSSLLFPSFTFSYN